jgi:hypothetical protein
VQIYDAFLECLVIACLNTIFLVGINHGFIVGIGNNMSYIDGSDIYHDLDTILLPTING